MKGGIILFMGKHFNPSIKLEIITKYFDNEASLDMLSKEYNISRSTIFKWIKQSREGKDITIRKKVLVDLKKKILIIKKDMKY